MDHYLNLKDYKMAKKEEKVFYVGIKEPLDLRRNLLESSKMIITSLQKHQKFTDIKLKKMGYVGELKRLIKEIKKLNNSLNSKLPSTYIKIEKKEKKKLPKKKSVQEDTDKEDVTRMSEVEKLESELMSIEAKLDSLNY